MQTPNREDWGEVDRNDLDAAWAFDTFFGKTIQEARALFAKNALYYQEGLGSMPALPFRFYVRALTDYLTSEDGVGDSDGACSFLELLLETFERRPEALDSVSEDFLCAAARHIALRQKHFAADPDIYGDFGELLQRIERARALPFGTPG